MTNGPIGRALRRRWTRRLAHRARPLTDSDLLRPTMVFAPHQDDECLGCGGTIARLRQADVATDIVFLTDGGHSHGHLMERSEMAARRRDEALAAAEVLGVPADRVHFLGFEDGRLADHSAEAVDRCAALIADRAPERVFVTYSGERPDDHVAANRIVHAAVARAADAGSLNRSIEVLEYPVWFWHAWPWSRQWLPLWQFRIAQLGDTLSFPGRLRRDFRTSVDIRGQLDTKRRALACHVSQMTRLMPQDGWATLGDIGGGDWLNAFFTGEEYFQLSRPAAPGAVGNQRDVKAAV